MASVYLLGAGASHEAGVPLTSHILPAALALTDELGRLIDAGRRPDAGSYLAALGPDDYAEFRALFEWMGRVFHAGELQREALPSLDVLWGVVEVAHSRGASFLPGAPPGELAAARAALLKLMYHVLVGSTVQQRDGETEFSFVRPRNPFAEFVRRIAEGDVLLTTNYDILLDQALWDAGEWIDYRVGGEQLRADARLLLKLHGSFNWLYCPNCDQVAVFENEHVLRLPLDSDRQAPCPRDGAPMRTVLVPPTLVHSLHSRQLRNIWAEAHAALRSAHRVVIAGYSMPDADVEIQYLIQHALSLNTRVSDGGVVVVNASGESLERYQRFLGSRRVRPVHGGFSDLVASLQRA